MKISETLKEIVRGPVPTGKEQLQKDIKEAVFLRFGPPDVVRLGRLLKKRLDERKG